MMRILIADDHAVVRRGLIQILESQADITIVGEAEDGDQVLRAVRSDEIDIVLLDLSMPGRSGLGLIKDIKRTRPDIRILVLSMHEEEQYAVRAVKAGAHGYLTKTTGPGQLLEALRKVMQGRIYMSPQIAEYLALGVMDATRTTEPAHTRLTEREYQVFVMLARGTSVTAIAHELHLSPKTVSTHKTRALQKMGFENLADLIRYALEEGIVDERRNP